MKKKGSERRETRMFEDVVKSCCECAEGREERFEKNGGGGGR